jgi:hypothetical protein
MIDFHNPISVNHRRQLAVIAQVGNIEANDIHWFNHAQKSDKLISGWPVWVSIPEIFSLIFHFPQ